jgi:hypothetical protein
MRLFLAGLLLLIIPSDLFAQATGQVLSLGFNGTYRPNSWTPMVIQLKPDTTDSANSQIQIFQHDLDGDKPVYTRNIVLNGSGQASEQLFWMYFLPQPINKGLDGSSLQFLQKDLQVFLYSADGKKPVAKLPLTSTLQNIDPITGTGNARSAKLILAVSSNGSHEAQIGRYNDAIGQLEDIEVVNLRSHELPDDPIAYEGVDAVVWLDGDPSELGAGNSDSFSALQDYVRFGGRLVICQSTTNYEEDKKFGDLLPVDLVQVDTKSNFEPLMSLAAPPNFTDPFQTLEQSWGRAKGPFPMVRATVRPGTLVSSWIDWKQDGSYADATPYIARKPYGLGQVTWFAQPLTVEATPPNPTGWPHVWNHIFDWKDNSYVLPTGVANDDPKIDIEERRYHPAGPIDLGFSYVQGLNLDSKTAWLIFLAVVFFLIYWVAAGPGTYAYLAAKKRQGLSWSFFCITALIATGVTMAVVKLVLRGPPQIRHVSFVRATDGQPAIMYSRFGLYIPRDGDQTIELTGNSPTSVSYIAPFAEHPQQLGDVSEAPAPADYFVPVRDLKSDTPPAVTVPYRSSLKKFQARWVGDSPMKFIGSVKLDSNDRRIPLAGSITNATGQDLSQVYLAFKIDADHNWMIYIPNWNKGITYDLKKDLGRPLFVGKSSVSTLQALPEDGKILSDEIAKNTTGGWQNYWFDHFRRNSEIEDANKDDGFQFTFPMLSVFNCLPGMKNSYTPSGVLSDDRVELYARGVRMLDMTSSISAGQLAIIASNKGPLPMPVEVDGDKITGDGVIFYQFTLPINRGKADEPTTRPVDAK